MLRSPLQPLLRKPLQSPVGLAGRMTLVHKAIGILRKYGTDAHVYLPGIGTVSGITAGNYLDSAGTTAASVDNPVGLSLDALQAMTLGPELVDTSVGAIGSSYAIRCTNTAVGSGFWSVTGNDALVAAVASQDPLLSYGKTYFVTLDISAVSGGNVALHLSDAQNSGLVGSPFLTKNSIGSYTAIVTPDTATRDSITALCGTSGLGVTFKLSIREIPGIHATQATTANKPILRQSAGKYSWQFDQSNDSLQTTITTGDAGWLCAGVTFTDSNSTLFCSGAGDSAQKGLWSFREASNDALTTYIGNGSSRIAPAAISAPAGQPLVVAAGWDASNIFHSVNSTENTATRTGSASPSPANLRIGAYTNGTTYPLGGNMNIALVFDVLPTATERLTLKRWVGQISGVSL
jgi:hypothetical protein